MSDFQNPSPAFSGTFWHLIDGKNRVTIPSEWRPGEGVPFALVVDSTNTFLHVMTPEEHRSIPGKLVPKDATEDQKRIFARYFFSRSQFVTVDKQGRLLLPAEFCTKLELTGEVGLVGADTKFEVWNKARWEAKVQAQADEYARLANLVGV